jgi:hypothetical protein
LFIANFTFGKSIRLAIDCGSLVPVSCKLTSFDDNIILEFANSVFLADYEMYRSLLQISFFIIGTWSVGAYSMTDNSCPTFSSISGFPLPASLLFVWPVPLIGLNELVKHYEIK